jgi:hypothetical protein
MAPRIAKQERAETPKPILQAGVLGFYPVTGMALATLAADRGSLIIGSRDSRETQLLKARPTQSICRAGEEISLDTAGLVFNGFSDAFYRGRLPQVILAMPAITSLQFFIDEFLDHLDKLNALGFFISGPSLPNPVESLIPCVVMVTYGVYFEHFRQMLAHHLAHMDLNTNVSGLTDRLAARFLRGLLSDYPTHLRDVPAHPDVAPYQHITLSGGNIHTRQLVQSVLSGYGLTSDPEIHERFEPPVERLEFLNVLNRLHRVVLPALQDASACTEAEGRQMFESVLSLGQHRGVLTKADGALPPEEPVKGAAAKQKLPKATLFHEDLRLFQTLHLLADRDGLSEAAARFQSMASIVRTQLDAGTKD